MDGPGGDLSGEAAVVLVGADDALDGETEGRCSLFGPDGDFLEVLEEGGAGVPGGAGAGLDYVVAVERADGDSDQRCGLITAAGC